MDRVQSGGQLRGPPQERGDGQVLCRLPRGDDLVVERAARGVIGDDAEHLVLQEARAVADDVLLILEAHQRGNLALQPSEVGPAAAAARPRLLDHRKVDARAVPEEHRLSKAPRAEDAQLLPVLLVLGRLRQRLEDRWHARLDRRLLPRLLDGRRVAALARLAPLVVARQLLDLRLDAADDRARRRCVVVLPAVERRLVLLTDFHVFARKGAQRALNRLRDENAEEYRSAVHGRLALESRPVAQGRPARGGSNGDKTGGRRKGALGDGREEELKLNGVYDHHHRHRRRDQRARRRTVPQQSCYKVVREPGGGGHHEHRARADNLRQLGVGPKPRVVVQRNTQHRLSDSGDHQHL